MWGEVGLGGGRCDLHPAIGSVDVCGADLLRLQDRRAPGVLGGQDTVWLFLVWDVRLW